MNHLKGRCAIVGIGETNVGKLPELTTLALHLKAIKLAVEDACLHVQDIDGLVTNQPLDDAHRSYAVRLSQAAGIKPTYATDLALGGATPCAMSSMRPWQSTPDWQTRSFAYMRGRGQPVTSPPRKAMG